MKYLQKKVAEAQRDINNYANPSELEQSNITDEDSSDEEKSLVWRDVGWKRALAFESKSIYENLSANRILACQQAISDLETYKIVLDGITSDPGYNLAALTADIYSADISSMKQIDAKCAKIIQADFSEKYNDLAARIERFGNMKEQLLTYIPVKNINIVLQNMEQLFSNVNDNEKSEKANNAPVSKEESENPETETEKSENAAGVPAEDAENSQETTDNQSETENVKSENKDNAIDLKQTKYYVEMLLINLSSLAQGDNNGGPSSDQLQTSRTAIMNLEDRYLNEKNPMLQAFSYFWINTGISRTIAKIALAFAIIVDLLNLIIGLFIQWIEKEDKQTVNSAQSQESIQDESTSGGLAQ